ncbi:MULTISPECIES: hypothetical protein [unclassified Pantoea]|uniref:hypothetical protein n=1 Tax=unclassified Pantoea TaxID=2630326 RepID=UPI001681B1FE|nr:MULTISPECIES: hypothetical protein [unclassified Pantoea]
MSRKIIGRSAIDRRYRLDPRYFKPLLPDGIRYDPVDDVYVLVAKPILRNKP